ncbi:MAG: hypothetical protein KDC38_08130 [Planctomycetes bacterium]|nr:hypothetical protein [Planctomycetota bacterium]
MVAYNTTTYVWSWKAKRASGANKAAAIAWMDSLPAIESHCVLDAGVTTVSIANSTPATNRRMLFLGNRLPFCWTETFSPNYPEECLTEITGANYHHIPIDTIFYPEFPGIGEEVFWVQLAQANGGTFTLAQ